MVWDEENRLRGINDNGRLHLYTYDHTGERALKSSAESSLAVINGLASAVITHTEDYTAYVSPYFVVQKGKFTKHYFEGSSRIVSKLGEGTFSHKNTGIMAGGLDYLKRTQKEQEARDRYIKGLNVPPGPPTQHGIYASPEWTGQPYPSIDWEAISQNQEPPEGWPRYPKFNEPGDVPGPPVQYGEPLTNANAKAGFNFIPNGVEEKNLYFYHPDHLGSSSYITDKNGEVIQHTEYMAFGEVLVDEHSTTNKMPYLFNGKELDYETGLYYYGARYYDAKTSIFLNVDPLAENAPNWSPYAYAFNNPVILIDPDGNWPIPSWNTIRNKYNQAKNYAVQKYNEAKSYATEKYTQATNYSSKKYSEGKTFATKKYNEVKTTATKITNNVVNTTKSTLQKGQQWVKDNKQELLETAKNIQDSGDGIAIAGYGATIVGSAFAGVGAVPGAKVAAVGNGISTLGSVIEIGTNFITGDYKEGTKNTMIAVGAEIVNKGLDRAIPGPTPDVISKESVEILKQDNSIKTKMIEKTVENKLENTKEK